MFYIDSTVKSAICRCIFQLWDVSLLEIDIPVSSTPDIQLGHRSTSICFSLAKTLKVSPINIAEQLTLELSKNHHFKRVANLNGYINFTFHSSLLFSRLDRFLKEDIDYTFPPNLKKALLEFISANPTGPLHIGHGRWAILGDCLARVLKHLGHDLSTEFYINDAGNQIQKFRASVEATRKGEPIPEGGYVGEYIHDLINTDMDPVEYFVQEHKTLIQRLGVQIDRFFSEKSLHTSHRIEEALAQLRDKNLLYVEDNATFFRTSYFGDDKDRAVVKANGDYTYFAPDIAYHGDKIKRGYGWIIDIVGADHDGWKARMNACVQVLSNGQVQFTALLGQLVKLTRGNDALKMSKRAGNVITVEELVDEIGTDAFRVLFLSKKYNHPIHFDLDLLKEKNKENPLFYIQYAYARICSILEMLETSELNVYKEIPKDLEECEISLLLHMLEYHSALLLVAKELDPYYLYAYTYELATLFHKFYEKVRVRDIDQIILYRVNMIQTLRLLFTEISSLLGINMPNRI